jgi:hypothetical protein
VRSMARLIMLWVQQILGLRTRKGLPGNRAVVEGLMSAKLLSTHYEFMVKPRAFEQRTTCRN